MKQGQHLEAGTGFRCLEHQIMDEQIHFCAHFALLLRTLPEWLDLTLNINSFDEALCAAA